jgi:predicted PurR-regulated permease PerM
MPDPTPERIRDYPQRILLAVGIALAAVVLALLVWHFAEVLLLVFAGTLFAVCVSAPSNLLAQHARMPRALALMIVIVALLLLAGFGAWGAGARVVEQVNALTAKYPQSMDQLEGNLRKSEWGQWAVTEMEGVRQQITMTGPLLGSARGILSTTFGVVGNIAAIVIVGLFLAVSPSMYVEGVIQLVPINKRGRAREVMARVGKTLEWWFLGQLLSMVVNAMLIWIGLLILGVPLALTLAILAGLMTFIPNFGPFIAATPAVLLALTANGPKLDFMQAFYVICLYVLVNVLDGSLITPTIQKRAVAIPPALIIVAQTILLIGFGPFGLIVATPMLAAVLVLVKALYIEDTLGDRPVLNSGKTMT